MKWMPLPKATKEQVGSENLQVAPLNAYCFINGNIAEEKVEAAELFLQFCHTDMMMEEFTELTGMFKPYNYEVSSEKMTASTKSVMDVRANSRIVYPMDDNPVYLYSTQSFRLAELFYSKYSVQDGTSLDMGAIMIQKDDEGYKYDIATIFEGFRKHRQDLWGGFQNVIEE